MKVLRSLLLSGFVLFVFYCVNVIFTGCAQIGMPVGGPKDTLPPVLLNATPPNFSTGFTGNRITLSFDEYIQLDNPFQNVLVSPLPKKAPFVDYRLRTVTVRIYDTLQPNKTYSIQFGKSIRDLNEGNPFEDFDYVFSTGPYIDSLSISGNVRLAETGKVDSTLTVMLYSDLSDSAVFKHKPEYIARLNKEGDFRFRYITPGVYQIFALKDQGGQYVYNSPEVMFAFADSLVRLDENFNEQIQLFAYEQEKPEPKPSTSTSQDTTLTVSSNLKSGTQGLLEPLKLTFNQPLRSFDSSTALLTDTLFNPISGVRYSVDSTEKIISVIYNWQGGADFRFILPATAAIDTNGRQLIESDTLSFKTKNESEYGSLKLTFKNLEKFENPVLQLVPESGPMESYVLSSNVFAKKLMTPGTYNIQILEDKNKNAKWDPGNYAERLQPEMVHRLTEPISIRANWENERDIEL